MEDRQVQHIFESNATSSALALNVACHKCLARGSNPRHLCSNQSILPLDYRDGQNSSWGTVLHIYLNQINNKTLTPNPKSGCNGNAFPSKITIPSSKIVSGWKPWTFVLPALFHLCCSWCRTVWKTW